MNRPVTGKLDVKLGNLELANASQTVKLEPQSTQEIVLDVTGGAAAADNTYPLAVLFDAGRPTAKVPHKGS